MLLVFHKLPVLSKQAMTISYHVPPIFHSQRSKIEYYIAQEKGAASYLIFRRLRMRPIFRLETSGISSGVTLRDKGQGRMQRRVVNSTLF
jgi:hypothetical protein